MKTFLKRYMPALLLVLLGTVAAVTVLVGRVQREEAAKTYDVVIDYDSLEEMAEESKRPMEYWLKHFRGLGVDKLGICETTAVTLAGEQDGVFFLENPLTIRSSYGWEIRFPEAAAEMIRTAEDGYVLGICTDSELTEWVLEAYERRCDIPVPVVYDEKGTSFFMLTGDGEDIDGNEMAHLPLGVHPEELARARQHGYTVIPRTLPVEGLNGTTFAVDVMAEYRELEVPYVIGGGDAVVGYDDVETLLPEVLEFYEEDSVSIGVVETSQQSLNLEWEGLFELVEDTGYDAVRVFSVWDYIQSRYGCYGYEGSQEITNSLYRAAYERGCRVIYLKMMKDGETGKYITDPDEYTTLLEDFARRMNERGYTMDTVRPMEAYSVNFPILLLVAFGAVAAAILVLCAVVRLPAKWVYILLAGGCLCAAGVLYIMPNTGRVILSIGGGIVLPAGALVFLLGWSRRQSRLPVAAEGLLAVAVSGVIALVGAVLAVSPLSDSAYMLEMELYRGVKVMQLVPMAVFACYFIYVFFGKTIGEFLNNKTVPASAKRFFALPPKTILFRVVVVLAVAVVTVVVGRYYVARTGHTGGAAVSALEMRFRALLEELLAARPRTKEFLVGWPCVMLLMWAMRKKLPLLGFFFGLGAAIGLTSVVNTFLHIRTPFMISLARVGLGLGFGVVIGLVLVTAAELLRRAVIKRGHHV